MPSTERAAGHFYALPVDGYPSYMFGKNRRGLPALLIFCSGAVQKPETILHSLHISYGAHRSVSSTTEPARKAAITSVTCDSEDASIQRYFTYVCETFIKILGDTPTDERVDEMIRHILDLFRRITKPATKELNGLLGELYYIYRSKDPVKTLDAWHVKDVDKYDFVSNNACLEVKTCTSRDREHQFSLEQCKPPSGKKGLLASIFIERTDVGLSLKDLRGNIMEAVKEDPILVAKLEINIVQCLGSKAAASMDVSFDEARARDSLKLFDLRDIPSISPEHIPREVSKIRFISSLNHVDPQDIKELAKDPRLAGLLPA